MKSTSQQSLLLHSSVASLQHLGSSVPQGAEFIFTYDNVVPSTDLNIADPNLAFVRDVCNSLISVCAGNAVISDYIA